MLTSAAWWKALSVLLWRQALQVLAPALLAIVAAGGDVDLQTTAVTVGGALVVTLWAAVWRALRGVEDPSLLGMIVRAGAGVMAGLAVVDLGSLAGIDWRGACVAAVAAMALAAIHAVADPPTIPAA